MKTAFDKYGHKLRKQLVKTMESVEQYQLAIGFQQNGSLRERTSVNSAIVHDDQGFFLDIIEKMRNLMTQMHIDMFQLICQEIETCLIEINNKFFVNYKMLVLGVTQRTHVGAGAPYPGNFLQLESLKLRPSFLGTPMSLPLKGRPQSFALEQNVSLIYTDCTVL